MAADYWASTQHNYWERSFANGRLTRAAEDALLGGDNALAVKYPLPESRLVNTYLQQQITKLGKRLNTRQIVLATAMVFVRRLYTTVDIRETNPYLVAATAFYLACKIEECPQHIKVVLSEARTLWSDYIPPDTSKLGECEFFLISKIHAQLIVHHPYRSLNELQKTLALSQDEMSVAWYVINDHYVTDLPLRYPPHVVACAAVIITLIVRPGSSSSGSSQPNHQSAIPLAKALPQAGGQAGSAAIAQAVQSKGQRLSAWLIQSQIDVEALIDCTQRLISLYVLWEQHKDGEKDCKERINHFVKEQGLHR